MPEGLHLNGNGLRLLMDLDQLDREITSLERIGFGGTGRHATLWTRRERMTRTAEAHCHQAGISWEKFQGVLEKEKGGHDARAE